MGLVSVAGGAISPTAAAQRQRMAAVAVLMGEHEQDDDHKYRPVRCNKWYNRENLMLKLVASPLVAAAVALSPISTLPAPAAASIGQTIDHGHQRGASLFRRTCIGCHDAGGNIIQPGATLFLKDLQRNGVDTEEEIYRVTYFGKGRMPGFGEKCTPRGQCTFGPRLQEDEIKLLAAFVKSQADQDWPAVAMPPDNNAD